MRIWTVHLPAGRLTPEDVADRLVAVKEGFSWPALLFGPLWVLSRRMWLVLAGYVAVATLLVLLGRQVSGPIADIVGVLLTLLFAAEANDLRRWTLGLRGFALAGIVSGRSKADAEIAFLHKWTAAERSRPAERPLVPGTQIAGMSSGHMGGPVLGLFPEPDGRA